MTIAANTDYVKSLRNTSARLTSERDILLRERNRNRGIRDIARHIDDDTVGRPVELFRQSMEFIQSFYTVCRIYHSHRANILELLTTLQDDALQQSDRESIITMVEDHHNKFLGAHGWLIAELALSEEYLWNNQYLLNEALFDFEYEYEDMINIVAEAEQLMNEKKATLAVVPSPEVKLRQVALGNGEVVLNRVVPPVSCPQHVSFDQAVLTTSSCNRA